MNFCVSKYLIVLSLLVLISSCSNKDDFQSQEGLDFNAPELQYLLKAGFQKSDIKDFGNFYLVQNDILFEKKRLIEDDRSVKNVRKQQASTPNLVNFDRQPTITVRIDNSMPNAGTDNWRPEIQQAVNDWNSIGDSRINIVLVNEVTAQVDVTILSDAVVNEPLLQDNEIAAAEFPLNDGRAGFRIRVNLDFLRNVDVTTGQKRYNIVHELGHCIGFRHTNWSSRNESSANQINGTPNQDPNSVMNGGTALNEWLGFSGFDQIALRTLYPESLTAERVYELQYFALANPDVNDAFSGNPASLAWHWLNFGINEGRRASMVFESTFYIQRNQDVAQAFGSTNYSAALNHWLLNGINEGRQASPVFNSQVYLQRNSDIRAAYGANNFQAALNHWLVIGISEGRQASADFDVRVYLDKYSDLKSYFGTNYQAATIHYLLTGRFEGRTAPNP
jgi:hypothetical protein